MLSSDAQPVHNPKIATNELGVKFSLTLEGNNLGVEDLELEMSN